MLVQVVGTDLRDELVVVGLHAGVGLRRGGGEAIEHGTSYRVIGAHGRVGHFLRRTGMSDVLAASDDLGALMLAVLLRRASTRSR